MSKHIWEVVRYAFSLHLFVSLAYCFAYFIHDQVAWRAKMHVGKGVRIHPSASIRCAENITLGKNSHINRLCCIWASRNSKIILGDNLLMGPGVGMFSSNHGIVNGRPMTFQPWNAASIVIGDDVWLGAHCIITAGVHIAHGVVVAAGAVVTHSIPEEGVIVGGVPAMVIGKRPSAAKFDAITKKTEERVPVLS